MLDRTVVEVVVAVAVLLSPLPFIAALGVALLVRGRTGRIPAPAASAVAMTGGLLFGTMLLVPADLVVQAPLLLVPLGVAVAAWRRRRRAFAGWFVVGVSLPWAILWGAYVVALAAGTPFEPLVTIGSFALGAVPLAVGLVVAVRADPPPPLPSIDAPAGQPGSRVIGSVAEALREPNRIGPFGQPEIAMVIAVVVALLIVPFLLPRDAPAVVRIVVLAAVVAVVATEVYVRSFPPRSRRAFEAFSWLGEWELARAREMGGGSVPTSRAAAERWLEARPDRPDRADLPLRIEILLLADRVEEARTLLDRLPAGTPVEAFEKAALADLVDFRAGGDGDLAALERAAAEILPDEGDDRLRAEVVIAVARSRRLMADPGRTVDPILPFLEVRERLGRRADGQVGRAYRRRLLPVLLVVGLAFGIMGELFGAPLM